MRLADSHPDWVVYFEDETWWSRFAQPGMRAWSAPGKPLRLVQKDVPPGEPNKALCCYSLPRMDTDKVMLRFVEGRCVGQVTCDFLAWSCGKLQDDGKRLMLLIWDNAGWHTSKAVKQWVKDHNRAAKKEGGVRIVVSPLPSRSPWLNPIEPRWVHGKRVVVEPNGVLSPAELTRRVCKYFDAQQLEPISQQLD